MHERCHVWLSLNTFSVVIPSSLVHAFSCDHFHGTFSHKKTRPRHCSRQFFNQSHGSENLLDREILFNLYLSGPTPSLIYWEGYICAAAGSLRPMLCSLKKERKKNKERKKKERKTKREGKKNEKAGRKERKKESPKHTKNKNYWIPHFFLLCTKTSVNGAPRNKQTCVWSR